MGLQPDIGVEAKPPQMDEPVLVLIPEVVDGPKVLAVEAPIALPIRLQLLDERPRSRAEPPDSPHATPPVPGAVAGPLVERALVGVERE